MFRSASLFIGTSFTVAVFTIFATSNVDSIVGIPHKYIFNAKNFNPHKKPISLLNVPICTQGMQRTWWPEAGTIIVTGPYSIPMSWKQHNMETHSTLLATVSGVHRAPTDSPPVEPVMRRFVVSFVVSLNRLSNNRWSFLWFETPWRWCDMWRHCHINTYVCIVLWSQSILSGDRQGYLLCSLHSPRHIRVVLYSRALGCPLGRYTALGARKVAGHTLRLE